MISVYMVEIKTELLYNYCVMKNNRSEEHMNDRILKVTPAEEWTAMFDRTGENDVTWLGADGIYTIPLNGNDRLGSADDSSQTFFVFSDTLMGASDKDGRCVVTSRMHNHTAALLDGKTPARDAIEYIYGYRANRDPERNLFDKALWLFDGVCVGDKIHVFGFPQKDWKPIRIDMITVPIVDGVPRCEEYTAIEGIKELICTENDDYQYALGIGITPNTSSAHAPAPDGYIYFYGYRDALKEFSRKDLIAARIPEDKFPDFSELRYWNGSEWTDDIRQSAPLISRVSCEMSVTPIPTGKLSGKYIAVFTLDCSSPYMMYSIGESPVGPFEEPVCFYEAPEHGTLSANGKNQLYTYNAKAHPHLSDDNRLLVSYNKNVSDMGEQYSVDYHPVFLWLDLDDTEEKL